MAVTGTVVAGSALAAGSTYATAATTTLIFGFAFTKVQLALLVFAASTAIGLALNALAPKPKDFGANRGYKVNQRGSALDHQIIYGKMKTGGVLVYDETTGNSNRFLHRLIAYAGHEVESFDEIYVGESRITQLDVDGNVAEVVDLDGKTSTRYNNHVRIIKHLGSPDQLADATLVSESSNWTVNHRLRGIAYLYVRLTFSPNAFPNGIPDISATIKGKKIFDPRNSQTVWSDNAALCLRDYLSEGFGLNETDNNLDDDLVSIAANICDETDTLSGEKRYTTNGAFVTSITPYDILGDLLSSMGGILWYSQGKWRMKPAYWTEPVLSLDENDLRSSVQVSTRHSRRDNYNLVRGTFRGEESNWQVTDYPEVTNSAFLVADNNQESVIDFDLPFTDTSECSRRIARVALERNRQQLTVKASFGLKAFQVQVGDNISLSMERFGWTNKIFEVTSWTFGITDGLDIQVSMMLREISESVFDEVDDGVVYETDNTNLLSPFEVPGIGLSATSITKIVREKLVNVIRLDVTSSSIDRIDKIEVQYKLSEDTDYVAAGFGHVGLYELIDLVSSSYDIRARAVNTFGVTGEWEYLYDVDAFGLLDPPSDVTDFSGSMSGGVLHLSWSAVPDLDLSFYRIRLSAEESSGTWANAITIVDKVPRPATSVSLPAKPGTYHIRAYDKSGVASTGYTSLVILEDSLEDWPHQDTATDSTDFLGTKTNCEVVSGTLRITDYATAPTEGTYILPDYVEVYHGSGALTRRFRARLDVFVSRFDSGSGLFDDIPGLFDDIPGLFDDFTGDVQFADTNVVTYISTTQDDPSLGGAVWTDYLPFTVTEVKARAARFKVKLTSSSNGVTPAISSLVATIDHE